MITRPVLRIHNLCEGGDCVEGEKITVSGVSVAAKGDDWFCVDETGAFVLDKTIIANIWLVGGGCDGGDGKWISYSPVMGWDGLWHIKPDTGSGTSYAGNGGDGGYVHVVSNIKISRNTDCNITVAEANDTKGTTITIEDTKYSCDDAPYIARKGGKGGGVRNDGLIIQPTNGEGGMITPYQAVGSSGGGGLSCNGFNNTPDDGNVSVESLGGEGAGNGGSHREDGLSAVNYGCGGGGGCVCGNHAAVPHDNAWAGGKGKKGCIIVQYKIYEKTLKVDKTQITTYNEERNCDAKYASDSSCSHCCN